MADLYPIRLCCDSKCSQDQNTGGRRSCTASYVRKPTRQFWITRTMNASPTTSMIAGCGERLQERNPWHFGGNVQLSTMLSEKSSSPQYLEKGEGSRRRCGQANRKSCIFHCVELCVTLWNKTVLPMYWCLRGMVAMTVTHVMQQITGGIVFGANAQKPWGWKRTLFSNKNNPAGKMALTFFMKAELQRWIKTESKDEELGTGKFWPGCTTSGTHRSNMKYKHTCRDIVNGKHTMPPCHNGVEREGHHVSHERIGQHINNWFYTFRQALRPRRNSNLLSNFALRASGPHGRPDRVHYNGRSEIFHNRDK